MTRTILALFLIATLSKNVFSENITLSNDDLILKLNENATIQLHSDVNSGETLKFFVQNEDIASISPDQIQLSAGKYEFVVKGKSAGHSEIIANTTAKGVVAFLRVTVYKIAELDVFSSVIGWIYFVAWSVSFYPQIYINFQRQSVIGLNFDFLALNVVGFSLYAIFNVGLFFIPAIKEQYAERHPRGLIPVQVNDIVFSLHATLACLVTIYQCYRYERAEQKVSLTAKIILGLFAVILVICAILVYARIYETLDFLYICSYVKLTITLIKYVPQAYMNYKRKSTVGWSIGNILLDFTGGILSMLQMILISYNYDDWVSIFGSPTKFGLGLFSVIFDIFFIVQHYVLYRHTKYEES